MLCSEAAVWAGLDARAANIVMRCVKSIVQTGRTIGEHLLAAVLLSSARSGILLLVACTCPV